MELRPSGWFSLEIPESVLPTPPPPPPPGFHTFRDMSFSLWPRRNKLGWLRVLGGGIYRSPGLGSVAYFCFFFATGFPAPFFFFFFFFFFFSFFFSRRENTMNPKVESCSPRVRAKMGGCSRRRVRFLEGGHSKPPKTERIGKCPKNGATPFCAAFRVKGKRHT